MVRLSKRKLKQGAARIKKQANELLDEQVNEETPEANKEDIVSLLVEIASHVERLTEIFTKNAEGDVKNGYTKKTRRKG